IAGLSRLLAALASVAVAAGVTPRFRGSPGVGTALVGLDGEATPEALAQFVDELRRSSPAFGGSVVLLEAPEGLRDGVDPWGPVTALSLMRSVKQQFDPKRRLAPGRFVGGI
ncbi:MAG TPA: FAD-linked oxidase C-terminal domain-containing protein, partial [Dermatophilaceae bacterium]|nr:FAD-linked oxidase C-terminal domain-containing protein [Dermatophilaceae bacterium]